MDSLPPLKTMLGAFASKDSRFDGVFFVAVKTTGVFCRPVCRAKPPLARNVEFFRTSAEALRNGYRACKLCRPLDAARRPPRVVEQLIARLDRSPGARLRGPDLVKLGIDPSTARRQFRSYCGMTFAAYQRARRMGLAMSRGSSGASVTRAQLDAGFESPSGFREAFARLFGTRVRGDEGATMLLATWLPTPLGPMIAIARDEGIVLLEFADRRALETGIRQIRHALGPRGAPAVIVPGEHPHLSLLRRELDDYFAGRRRAFTVPLAPRGTPFERRAWDYLCTIDFGQTRTYRAEAAALGNAAAVRAVGRANGRNRISILIPCHRVIASSGELCGYGGGVARKRWLLEHERQVVQSPLNRLSPQPATSAAAFG